MREALVNLIKCRRLWLKNYRRWQVISLKQQGKSGNMCVFVISHSCTTITNAPKGLENKPEKVLSNKEYAAPVFMKKKNTTLDIVPLCIKAFAAAPGRGQTQVCILSVCKPIGCPWRGAMQLFWSWLEAGQMIGDIYIGLGHYRREDCLWSCGLPSGRA